MNNDDLKIKKFIAERLRDGIPLAQIQQQLNDELDCRMTFFDLRMLAAELEDVDWTQFDPEPPKKEEATEDDAKKAAPAGAADGKTVVEMSKLARPGALAHGTVKFASGATAEWLVDQMGRLGLDKVSGEPSEEDFKAFQKELQTLFAQA